MKYKHHPKQEYPDEKANEALREARDLRANICGLIGIPAPSDQVEVTGGYIGNVEPQKQQAGFYSKEEWDEVDAINESMRPADPPTLFERFNSLCTPAQYVQLKKEILNVYDTYSKELNGGYQFHPTEDDPKMGTWSRVPGNPSTPWPQELEGFTEEIIESL